MQDTSVALFKIAIVGPESTGKSELAAALALHYNTLWVKEYAREYLNQLNRGYEYADLLEIAKGQMKLEDDGVCNINPLLPDSFQDRALLFCDTNLAVIKIWSDYKYGKCDDWISNEIMKRKYSLHLLTDIDLPWQYDPLRENPDNRREIFDLYHSELKQQQVTFEVVSGIEKKRIANAISIVEKHLINFTKN